MPPKQAFWDRPGNLAGRRTVDTSLVDARSRTCFLAANAPHTDSWFSTLPVANCGLKLDDEAVRVAVGLRLGLNLSVPHTCICGSLMRAVGMYALLSKRAPSMTRQALNDIIWRTFTAAGSAAIKEPQDLSRSDGKCPEGRLIPWRGGKPVTWM